MTNLLSAQFSRLFKSKLFYLSLIFFAGWALYLTIPEFFYFGEVESFKNNPWEMFYNPPCPMPFTSESINRFLNYDYDFLDFIYNVHLAADTYLNSSFVPYVVITALIISLLIGREFGNNTIRNKIILGYSRPIIYAANLIVCVSAGIIMQLVYIIMIILPEFIVYLKYKAADCGVYLFENSFKDNLIMQLTGFAIIAVYCSLFLFMTMTASSNYRGVIATLLTVVILIIANFHIQNILYKNSDMYYDDYSTASITEREALRGKNLHGTTRIIYNTLDDILPIRQAYYLQESFDIPVRTDSYIIYDIGIIAIVNAVGITLFKHKELK